ncbi:MULTISPECIES: MFS transporter [unclassified Streptomyces]|uniref:MFS transporter n=1 Tax=unclassified Streptomyces TaxID=2593676 RepID=UPI00224CC49B|nr:MULTISPECIES: MFS transporter [unclassified Streptomyces]MCX4988368.1 MFS transporter [Streptomyces sp. NBC_00568]MCX5006427.1 MFS transporter [Streptomyces sp. NBC_00638]
MPEAEKKGAATVPAPAGPAENAPKSTPETAPAPTGYGPVFAVPEFRAVFAAHAFSLLGLVVSEIALSVLVYDLTGSPLLSALTFALGFLPYLIGGTLLAGVADRFPARRVLVVCDLVCAGCVAVMVVPGAPIAVLLAMRAALALVAPVFQGTRTATLADVLGDGELFVLGRSLLRIVSQSALLAGFGTGGLLLTVVSPRHALLVTVCTFLVSAVLLRFGTRRRPARAYRGQALVRDSLRGARQVLADRRILVLLLLFWVPPMFAVAPEALAAPYADGIGAGSTGLGLLMCALPVGTIAGELFAGARLRPATRNRLTLPLVCVTLLPYAGYALRPGLGWSLVLLVLAGAGSAYTLGLDQWFVRAVPDELLGRAMTLNTAGLMTVQGLGMALSGVVAEFAGVRATVVGAGVLGTAVCAGLAVAARRTERGEGRGAERGRDGAGTGPAQGVPIPALAGADTETRDGADHDVTGR